MPTTAPPVRHLLGLDGLSRGEIVELLDGAEAMRPVAAREQAPLDVLAGRVIGNLFLEDSTRTRGSFTVAALRLGAATVDFGETGTSRSKGESLVDTALNIEAMGVDALVVRCSAAGGPALIARHVRCPVINAGDGRHEHPTQGLLDLLTLRDALGELDGRTVAIVGDIAASRVARSAMHGLVALGARVILCGPPSLVPADFEQAVDRTSDGAGTVQVTHELDPVLAEIDAIMMLRVQFERGSRIGADYRELYGLTAARAARLRPDVPVLHPGPMNRGLEIDAVVADDPSRSAILKQVTNGVAVRMGVLARALG